MTLSPDGLARLKAFCNALEPELSAAQARVRVLEGALRWFLEDERFQVAVGGNPNVVERMIKRARQALTQTEGEGSRDEQEQPTRAALLAVNAQQAEIISDLTEKVGRMEAAVEMVRGACRHVLTDQKLDAGAHSCADLVLTYLAATNAPGADVAAS